MINYEGHIVKKKNGTSRYMVICRDWFGGYVLQSCRSRRTFMVLSRKELDNGWLIEEMK